MIKSLYACQLLHLHMLRMWYLQVENEFLCKQMKYRLYHAADILTCNVCSHFAKYLIV